MLVSFSGLHHAQGGAFSPDGERVALGDTGIFAIPFTAAAFSQDGRLLTLGREDASTSLVDAETGQLLKSIESRLEITSVAFSPMKSLVAIGSRDGTVLLIALGVTLHFGRHGQATDQGMTERSHQLWNGQVIHPCHPALTGVGRKANGLL